MHLEVLHGGGLLHLFRLWGCTPTAKCKFFFQTILVHIEVLHGVGLLCLFRLSILCTSRSFMAKDYVVFLSQLSSLSRSDSRSTSWRSLFHLLHLCTPWAVQRFNTAVQANENCKTGWTYAILFGLAARLQGGSREIMYTSWCNIPWDTIHKYSQKWHYAHAVMLS